MVMLAQIARGSGLTLSQFLDRPYLDVALDVEGYIAAAKAEQAEVEAAKKRAANNPPPNRLRR